MIARPWRVLLSGKNRGACNMAVDAALLKEVEEGRSPPTLRIYGWNPWCISLGYFQKPLRELDAGALRDRGWDFVLRPTGGRAVLHAEEITYSLIARRDEAPWCATLAMSYERIGQAWAVALDEFNLRLTAGTADRVVGATGPSRDSTGSPQAPLRDHRLPLQPTAPCFVSTSRSELAFGERKVVGSAQRRTREAFLQHGSIPLTPQHERLVEALRLTESKRREYLEALKSHAISLEEIGTLPYKDLEKWSLSLAETLLRALDARFEQGALTDNEKERAIELEKEHLYRQQTFFEEAKSTVIPA